MAKLDDLPSLGGPPGAKSGGFGRFGGFSVNDADADPMVDESNDGFDDFDMNEDAVAISIDIADVASSISSPWLEK